MATKFDTGLESSFRTRRSKIPVPMAVLLSAAFVVGVFTGRAARLSAVPQPEKGQLSQETLQKEEREDYYGRWLKQDAVYIITREERQVFDSLTTDEERERFVEQFWIRRDPDPRTPDNEFKEEHYRRIAYVNERFGSGLPGWRTDRGKTYIIHGPPDEIEPHPSGGAYDRPSWEGGGSTATFPFEIWRYRHIKGLGSDILLEFVDRSYSGEYRLALEPEEKDAFLYVPNLGLTMAEHQGLATKAQRPFFDPTNRDYPIFQRFRDRPFERWALWNRVHHVPKIKYTDLQEIVKVDLSYEELPFRSRLDYFKLNDRQVLVPISVQVQNRDLSFADETNRRVARVAVYGIITSMTRTIVTEFDDDLTNSFGIQDFDKAVLSQSVYQKIVPLDQKNRYRLDLVVKDLNSGNVGVSRQAIVVPGFDDQGLTASSVLLTDSFQLLEDVPAGDQMFVIGDVWIHPSLDNVFQPLAPLGVYFQVYNVGFDQSTLSPAIQVKYEVLRGEQPVIRLVEHGGESLQFVSERRLVFLKQLPAKRFSPGEYTLSVEVQDRVRDQVVTVRDRFQITDSRKVAASLR